MNKIIIEKSPLNGRIMLPPSKSCMHRAIICAALSSGRSTIGPIILSDDIIRTINAVTALGAAVSLRKYEVRMTDSSMSASVNGVLPQGICKNDELKSGPVLHGEGQACPLPDDAGCTVTGSGSNANYLRESNNLTDVRSTDLMNNFSSSRLFFADITGISIPETKADINCSESGSTLRFMIPVAAALGVNAHFTGSGRLPMRPLSIFTDTLPLHGVNFSGNMLPISISGRLTAGEYIIDGSVSSQFITGLLFALPMLDGSSSIKLSSPLQSASYIDITIDILREFGINIEKTPDGYFIPGPQKYTACDYIVESDWSHSAFFIESAMIGGEIFMDGLKEKSVQGDIAVLDIARRMGCDIAFAGSVLLCRHAKLRGTVIDASDIPDLIPALAAAAAMADGQTRIINAGRLRIKECDRLSAVAEGLKALGAGVTEGQDSLTITGVKALHGGKINGYNDHRIVMAFAVLGSHIGSVEISDAGAVKKSYPDFFEDFKALGGKYNVI